MCEEIDKTADACKQHRAEWLEKPKFRKVAIKIKAPRPYFHYDFTKDAPASAPDPVLQELIKDVKSINGHKVIALIGAGGTGKSWLALNLMKQLAADPSAGIDGFFFWSSYYTDDALNGLDRALKYLDATPDTTESRLVRLSECLRGERKYFLVFDGVERFLHETREPGKVRSNTGFISRFLETIVSKQSNSTVVLTSRICPSDLRIMEKEPEMTGCIKIINAEGFTVQQAKSLLATQLDDRRIASVVSWLRGHRYGVVLASMWLQNSTSQDPFRDLQHVMPETDPERRVSRMIGLSVESLNKYSRDLLQELAIFTAPMSRSLIAECTSTLLVRYLKDCPSELLEEQLKTLESQIEGATSKSGERTVNGSKSQANLSEVPNWISARLIDDLKARKLLFQVEFDGDRDRYIVHPTVREYIFHYLHHSTASELPNLALSGFTSGSDLVYPGEGEAVRTLNDLFLTLNSVANTDSEDGYRQEACRDMFGLVRSRMVANTVPRWTRYENYLGFLARVIDASRNASTDRWDYAIRDPQNTQPLESENAPLYAEEVAWLYNEAGLAYYSEGSMMDAIAVWEQGYEINKVLDSEREGGHYVFQSLCNLGAANIHFGRLRIAESYLRHALSVGQRIREDDHIARVEGYLGVVRHLQGNLEEAEDLYKKAAEKAKNVGNLRAVSIFRKHYADLLIKQKKCKEAEIQIQISRAMAEAGHYPDLLAYARLSLGHLHRSRNRQSNAIREYRVALAEARRLGIHRLEAEAHSELARVALDLGDAQVARRRAMKTLQIANEHILGLRQTHGMLVLGKATVEAGERELGMHYIRHARRLAALQEYRIRYDEAEAALHYWGEPIEELEVEPLILSPSVQNQTKIQIAFKTKATGASS